MKGLQLVANSYGPQHQKHQKASNERITANHEQLWTAASKTSKGKQLRITADCEQLWTATSKTSKESKVKGLQHVKICEQWKDCIIKDETWSELHTLHVKFWL